MVSSRQAANNSGNSRSSRTILHNLRFYHLRFSAPGTSLPSEFSILLFGPHAFAPASVSETKFVMHSKETMQSSRQAIMTLRSGPKTEKTSQPSNVEDTTNGTAWLPGSACAVSRSRSRDRKVFANKERPRKGGFREQSVDRYSVCPDSMHDLMMVSERRIRSDEVTCTRSPYMLCWNARRLPVD